MLAGDSASTRRQLQHGKGHCLLHHQFEKDDGVGVGVGVVVDVEVVRNELVRAFIYKKRQEERGGIALKLN